MRSLKFNSALDIFGGTGIVSYLFKKMGKQVFINDYLKFNYYSAKALIENAGVILTDDDIAFLLGRHKTIEYNTFVQDTFQGMYYTNKENKWIDSFLGNWVNLSNKYPADISEYKRAIAFAAFTQCALKKRPFNLFHRANLNLRMNNVKRTFGNKASWDGSFDSYFKTFVREINNAVFPNHKNNVAFNKVASALRSDHRYDLIYIDPPYIREGVSAAETDYMKFYHFLEGASDPGTWKGRINYDSKNRHLADKYSNDWIKPNKNRLAFEGLFDEFRSSIIVISYKEPGIPSRRQLINSLKKYKKHVVSVPGIKYDYALNKNNGFHKEYLLIGMDK